MEVILIQTQDYSTVGIVRTITPKEDLLKAGFKPYQTAPGGGREAVPIPGWYVHPDRHLNARILNVYESVEDVLKIQDGAKRLKVERANRA